MKYKSFRFNVKSIDNGNDKNIGIIKGLASTFGNIDRDGDIMMPGAFTESLNDFKDRDQKIPMLSSHQFDALIGGYDANEIRETSEGLEVVGQVDLNTQQGQESHSLAKNGFLTSFSIGFSATRANMSVDDDGNTLFHKVELFEISLTPFPANQEAVITSVKTATPYKDYSLADLGIDWDSTKSVEQIKNKTGSNEKPSATYKNGFMWFDAENPDLFASYKLPFVYADGDFEAIPKGIFAITAVLNGSRGGVDIPAKDRAGVERNVNGYYKKMDRDLPFPDSGLPSGAKNFTTDDQWVKRCKLITFLNENILAAKLNKVILDVRQSL